MTVNTTFLPKTSGLVFSDRLVARSDKGRVFLAGTTYNPLQVVTKALWLEDNVYEVGETIAGYSATFTGGSVETVYRSRAQYRKFEDDQWQNSEWFEHGNEVISVPVVIPVAGQIRFMTQAFDESVGVYRVMDKAQSFASVRTVPFLSFGAITGSINAADYDIFSYPPYQVGTGFYVNLAVNTDGDASPTYKWASRSTQVEIVNPDQKTTQVKCTASGTHIVTCEIEDQNTEEGVVTAHFYLVSTL